MKNCLDIFLFVVMMISGFGVLKCYLLFLAFRLPLVDCWVGAVTFDLSSDAFPLETRN